MAGLDDPLAGSATPPPGGGSLPPARAGQTDPICPQTSRLTHFEIPGGPDRTLSKKGGFTARHEGLPVGAKCELRETSTGGADAVSIVPDLGDSGVGFAEVRNGAHVEITVRNSFNTAPGGSKPRLENTGSGTLLPRLGAVIALTSGGMLLPLRRRRDGVGHSGTC
ncbi:DUF5979 domain-containing protein [Leucobacter iarius]|uniref:DUF5979 domain-containing protein n=1 Tax=Leucobacter iarius TaxID=333963 RepID=A0ABP4XFQ8_9MICO